MSKLLKKLQKQLNEMISEGLLLIYEGDDVGASDELLEAWEIIKQSMDEYGIESIEAFDRDFEGKESVFNMASELDMTLENAARENPSYWEKRIKFCEEYLERNSNQSDYNIMNMKRAIAESHFRLGNDTEGERHFQQIVAEDPTWSWGWIGWSDMYWLFGSEEEKDSEKAINILLLALKERELDERHEVQQRLKDVYHDLGRDQEAEAIVIIREESKTAIKQVTPKQVLVKVTKVGRNEPCPCGSGKKYKKCCGK